MRTLGVALGFVGNYAPCGLSPQTDGMPVIPKKSAIFEHDAFYIVLRKVKIQKSQRVLPKSAKDDSKNRNRKLPISATENYCFRQNNWECFFMNSLS
jgi:hypothetical protein